MNLTRKQFSVLSRQYQKDLLAEETEIIREENRIAAQLLEDDQWFEAVMRDEYFSEEVEALDWHKESTAQLMEGFGVFDEDCYD